MHLAFFSQTTIENVSSRGRNETLRIWTSSVDDSMKYWYMLTCIAGFDKSERNLNLSTEQLGNWI